MAKGNTSGASSTLLVSAALTLALQQAILPLSCTLIADDTRVQMEAAGAQDLRPPFEGLWCSTSKVPGAILS